MEIYLDNSATTPVCNEAIRAVNDALQINYGNPGAVHSKGNAAKMIIAQAKKDIASVLGALPEEIYFSHSGTLANNTAVFGAAMAKRKTGNRIITTSLEHPSVQRCTEALEEQGFEVIRLSPGKDGSFLPEELISVINSKTVLISAMLVNNETGAINPVQYIKSAVKRVGAPALIHIDAIQGFGKLPIKCSSLGADMITLSSHKLHGPKGVGALYLRKGVNIKNHIYGGNQEGGLFSGTENVPGIAGFGAAVRALPDIRNELNVMQGKKDYLLRLLQANPRIKINSPENGLPYIVNLSVLGIPSQVLINYLSENKIYVSAGSACKKGHRSEVLTRLGFPNERIDSAIRVSMSRFTTEEDLKIFSEALNAACGRIRVKI
ncbi:MAG: cysteine desulfurase [Oscillospiraceae bacterium]|nr:cysteine desulfurase [Oscillospiraceae bacterium]